MPGRDDVLPMQKIATSGPLAQAGLGQVGRVLVALNPGQVIADVVGSYCRYRKVAAREQTKRHAIAAHERVTLDEIRLRRDLFLGYLERSFDERQEAFGKLFAALDAAVERGDSEALAATLEELAAALPMAWSRPCPCRREAGAMCGRRAGVELPACEPG